MSENNRLIFIGIPTNHYAGTKVSNFIMIHQFKFKSEILNTYYNFIILYQVLMRFCNRTQ